LQIYDEEKAAKVKQGIRFILSHFEGRQQLFPRKMSTALSQGRQFIVYSEDQILTECEKAGFVDCRLNAYFISEESQFDAFNIFSAQAPNIIFIDIDLPKDYESKEEEGIIKLNKTLKNTLNMIKKKLDGCKPTVLWTGNGYHVYIVLNTRPLELITELTDLSDKPSEEFLRLAELTFTDKKKDSCHNPSFKSSLLRIPYTLNSKCIDPTTGNYIKYPKVKIIQEFDSLAIPTINNKLLREFRLYLADKDIISAKLESAKRSNQINKYSSYSLANADRRTIPASYQWIERLVMIAIADHRKHTIDLVLAPFLIVIKHMSAEQAYDIIKDWIIKCNSIEMLKPSIEYFDNRIKAAINNSIHNGIPPILQDNIEKRYPDWYRHLKEQNIISDIAVRSW
jgi:hypothetical protein